MDGSEFPLDGHVVIVTGAGRGIGQAIARALAGAGADVCCVSRSLSQITATVGQIESAGGAAMAVEADLRTPEGAEIMVEAAVRRFGGVDILVANAGGLTEHKTVEQSNSHDWQEVLQSNLVTTYHSVHAIIPVLKQRGGGKIITVGSRVGHLGMPGSSAYAVAKAGTWMLTRVLAQELHKDNITVNELVPGPVQTEGMSPELAEKYRTEMNEWVKEPGDVGPMAVFLATQPAHGPTGQSFSLTRR